MNINTPAIQAVIEQYKNIGWNDVKAHDFGRTLPIVVAWGPGDKFSIHLELAHRSNDSVAVHWVNIFVTGEVGALGGWYFQGHHLRPDEVKAIIGLVTGKVTELEIEEEAGTNPVKK